MFNLQQGNSVYADSGSTSLTNDDIYQEWRNWNNRFLEIVSRHIPTKVIKKRTSPPWFDHEIRHLLKKKETARRKAKKSGCLSHWRISSSTSFVQGTDQKETEGLFPVAARINAIEHKEFWSVFKSVSKTSNVPSKNELVS